VNTAEEDQFFDLNLDITLPETPCAILSLDIVDVTGVHVVDVQGTIKKHRLSALGEEIEVYDAYQKKYANQ